MNKAIWKYSLKTINEQTIEMPTGASILCCQVQCGLPCLWVLVDTAATKTVLRKIVIKRTGFPFDGIGPDNYIGTYQLSAGQLVFHVFTPEDDHE